MDIYIWMLTFIIIFMLHNLEEIITIERWFQKTYPRVKKRNPLFIQKQLKNNEQITTVQFSLVIFVFSLFVSLFILIAVVTQHDFIFLGVSLFFVLNIFTHPLQSLYLRCYTPGVFTSIILIIPYYTLYFYHFYNSDMFSLKSMIGAILMIVILILVFFLSHKIGKRWAKSHKDGK